MIKIKRLKHCWQRYNKQENLSEWWVREKLDGVHTIRNGEKHYFRSGKLISAPDWFIEDFPEQLMDGEL